MRRHAARYGVWVSDSPRLAALLRTTGRDDAPEGVAEALDRACTRGSAAWPTLQVPEEDIGAAIGAAIGDEPDLAKAIDELQAEDLWLACACALGQRAAMEALDEKLVSLRPTLARIGADRETIDDLMQQIRARLLADTEDRPARIRSYRGRGDLRSWLKVVVVRDGMRAVKRERQAPIASDELDVLMDPGADPELQAMRGSYAESFREAFTQALAGLSARDRNVLRYHLVDGLSIDELGAIYRVHRATAARWLVKIRETLYDATRRKLLDSLALSPSELDSVIRMIRSRLDASIAGRLDPDASGQS